MSGNNNLFKNNVVNEHIENSQNKNIQKQGTEPLSVLNIFKKELPPLDFVFTGLKSGTIGFISSAGGTGKSMLALHLAFSLADTTKTYNFIPVINNSHQRGIVCYLNLEDPTEILENRIQKISRKIIREFGEANGYKALQSIDKNLMVYGLYGKNFNLYKDGELQDKAYNILLKLGHKSRLIIIDTFRRLHGEDENNNAKMSEILKILEEICNKTGTTILLLHHQNKTAILEKSNGQTAMRGASALVDNARLLINMSVLSKDEAKELRIQEEMRKHFVKVTFAKVNYAAIPNDVYLVKGFDGTLDVCNCTELEGADDEIY
jgi:RecA-family ATPase